MGFPADIVDAAANDADSAPFASRAARRAASAGLGFLALASVIAAAWIGAVGLGAYLGLGPQQLSTLGRLEFAGLAMLAILPAMLILFSGMAAREGARARAEARRLADAADRMLNPSPTARQSANRVGVAVRQEIDQLDRALESVLLKLRETEGHVARQTSAVNANADAARAGAQAMITGMERERDALGQIAIDLNAQAKLIGDQISRHVRVLSDAARLAETEVHRADTQLDQRLTSFSAATQLIGDRTHALHAAAQASSDSALRLEGALSHALDALAKATSLTDAARQNADQAGKSAEIASTAVRDTSARALDEARHVADLIRAEAAAMERDAARAIERLREAAEAARDAAGDVRAASGAAVAAQLQSRQVPAPPPEGPQRPRSGIWPGAGARPATPAADARAPMAPLEDLDGAWNALERSQTERTDQPRPIARQQTDAAPTAAPMPAPARRPSFAEQLSGATFQRGASTAVAERPKEKSKDQDKPNKGGGWRWRDMLAAIDREDRKAAAAPASAVKSDAPRSPAPAMAITAAANPFAPAMGHQGAMGLQAREQATATVVSYARHPLPVVAMLDAAGVRLSETFAPGALERIAQRARNGTQARRRAVREAAGEAVERVERALRQDPAARAEAGAFLRSEGARLAELLGRGRAAMTADATRAFLLLDAASA